MDIKITKKVDKSTRCANYKVVINNKPIKINKNLEGCRDKFTYKNIIIKVDSDAYAQHTPKELDLYKKIENKDKKYFPKLIKGNRRIGYVIQEKVQLTEDNITDEHCKLVKKLIKKYKLNDITPTKDEAWNWALNKKTGQPCIFDLGFYYEP